MDENTSLINIGELSRPATMLVEKISDAVGGIFKPYQIVRVAKAEAQADQVRAESQIGISDLQRRAFHRFLEEEGKKQKNIEDITQKALPLLEENSKPNEVEDDWITNFFDRCRLISDDDMQSLWSRVLAGEANSPGTYSKRTVGFLSDLDKYEAELFTRLCGFVWRVRELVPLIYDETQEIYNKHGIDPGAVMDLETIGLIQYELVGFRRVKLPKRFPVSYYGTKLILNLPQETGNELDDGRVVLTKIGLELAPICGSKPVEGFFDYVTDRWKSYGYIIDPEKT
ncbi:MAG TPA: DUF2806 domain-containing protein [Pyrinomonadaceae bacterium]|nr:DUF2806 domain-containing protein [Pyrinomonadaceae bacterium]